MSQTLLPYEALAKKGISFSKCHLWRLEKQNRFPKRVSISARRHGWFESEVDAWLSARGAERDASPIAVAGGLTELQPPVAL